MDATKLSIKKGPNVMKKETAVIVTTTHRGVFFGYATDIDGEIIKLRGGRNCLYWPASNKGFIGLAAMGPLEGSRVGPPATISLRDITSVIECSGEAAKLWEGAPWSA